MPEMGAPSEATCRVFVDKLIAFRAGLSTDERPMLDALVDASHRAHDQGDVQVYWYSTFGSAGNSDVWAPYRNSATYTGMQAGNP